MNALTVDSLLALERAGWDALSSRTRGSFYGDLMTDDALMVLVNGMVLDRAAVVASLDQAPAWDDYDLGDTRLVPLGRDAGTLVYRARARRGDDPPFDALMSSTYVLVEGRARLAFYQQTTATHR